MYVRNDDVLIDCDVALSRIRAAIRERARK